MAEEIFPIDYSDVALRDSRKLHSLPTSVQKDKAVRLPKQKPHFSYGSGRDPEPPFLHQANNSNEPFDSDDSVGEQDFPSPSALVKEDEDTMDPFESGTISYQKDTATSFASEESMGSLEEAMVGFEDSVMLRAQSPRVNSSFANKVFDFEAFPDRREEEEMFSSPLMTASRKLNRPSSPLSSPRKDDSQSPRVRNALKRRLSDSPENPEMKHNRITNDEPTQQMSQQPSVPAWVDEFDSDIIEGLKGFVDFVD